VHKSDPTGLITRAPVCHTPSMRAAVHLLRRSESSPPALVDPRRIGALVGLIGAATFTFSYTGGWDSLADTLARLLVGGLVLATVAFLFFRPRHLGPFVPPTAGRIGVYLLCVVGQLALIALGSRWLEQANRLELRPALIALVVGLHFLPFGWAFSERMFLLLGAALVVLGGAGLLLGSTATAEGAAVLSGVVMAGLLLAYGLGAFAPRRGASSSIPAG